MTESRNNGVVNSEMTTNAKQDSGQHDQTQGTVSAGRGIHVVTKPIGPPGLRLAGPAVLDQKDQQGDVTAGSVLPEEYGSLAGARNAKCWLLVRADAPNIDLKQPITMNRGCTISALDIRSSFSTFASTFGPWPRCWKTAFRHHA